MVTMPKKLAEQQGRPSQGRWLSGEVVAFNGERLRFALEHHIARLLVVSVLLS